MAISKSENYYHKMLDTALESFCAFWARPLKELLTDENLSDMKILSILHQRLYNLTASETKLFSEALSQIQKEFPYSPKTFLLLGHQYFFGIGIPQDIDQALASYEKAGNNPAALNCKGLIYEIKQAYADALSYYQQAADQNYPSSEARIGILYYNGMFADSKSERGYKLFRDALKKDENDYLANYCLGLSQQQEKRSDDRADYYISSYKHFLASIKNGHTSALFNIIYFLDSSNTISVINDEKRKIECLFLEAAFGNKTSLKKLIEFYINPFYVNKLKSLLKLTFTPNVRERFRSVVTYPFNKVIFDYHMGVLLKDSSFVVSLFANEANHETLTEQFLQWDTQINVGSDPFWYQVLNTIIGKGIPLPEKISDIFYSMVSCKLLESEKISDQNRGLTLASSISDPLHISPDACWTIGLSLLNQIDDEESFEFVYSFLIRGAENDKDRQKIFEKLAQKYENFKQDMIEPVPASSLNILKTNVSSIASQGLSTFNQLASKFKSSDDSVQNNNNNNDHNPPKKLFQSLAESFSKWSGISGKQSKTSEPSIQSQTIPEQDQTSQNDVMQKDEPRSDSGLGNN